MMDKITIERQTLLPCPFCGGEAEILTIPEDHPDAGAMFVQCCDSRCMTSSALLYPLMDDVRALLVERWNRRAALAAQPSDIVNPISQQEPVACKGIPRKGCNYLAYADTVCNKCGEIHHHHQMLAHFYTAPPAPAAVQEPVGWIGPSGFTHNTATNRMWMREYPKLAANLSPVYAAPPAPAAVPLTDEQDTARYRWLRKGLPYTVVVPTPSDKNPKSKVTIIVGPNTEAAYGESLDAAIDAAMIAAAGEKP